MNMQLIIFLHRHLMRQFDPLEEKHYKKSRTVGHHRRNLTPGSGADPGSNFFRPSESENRDMLKHRNKHSVDHETAAISEHIKE